MNTLSTSVIIATRNRCEPLRDTLATLREQSVLPSEAIIVDSSDTQETEELIATLNPPSPFPLRYLRSEVRSAARQRNQGVEQSMGDLLVFMDDDVLLAPYFMEELVRPFYEDRDGRLAGVSGTIVNQTYSQPRGLNRLLLACCLGNFEPSWAGRLLGPAVNFLPEDKPDVVQPVDWLFSGGTAYRRDIFARFRFGDQFSGYSFSEDVHLSSRIAREYRLCNTTRARFEHLDLGQNTHRDWAALGESMVTNRRAIMVDVLQKTSAVDTLRLFAYEIGYCTLAMLAEARFRPSKLSRIWSLLRGKLRAFGAIL
jgi:glycosyltransferase involved in cell wall biosynthesis